jgi:HPt (histidine-containing phosphotransfer) domain-containing protein
MRNDPSLAGMFATLDQFAAPTRLRITGLYCQSIAEQLPVLARALAVPDLANLTLLAHRVAGSAAMMQDANLAPRAKALEAAAAEGALEAAQEALEAVEEAAAYSIQAIRAVYGAGN